MPWRIASLRKLSVQRIRPLRGRSDGTRKGEKRDWFRTRTKRPDRMARDSFLCAFRGGLQSGRLRIHRRWLQGVISSAGGSAPGQCQNSAGRAARGASY